MYLTSTKSTGPDSLFLHSRCKYAKNKKKWHTRDTLENLLIPRERNKTFESIVES